MMILENLFIQGPPLHIGGTNRIVIKGDRIQAIQSLKQDYTENNIDRIQFENAVALPGFINSHDHLEFNSFPLLANRVYNNYTEWARDIQITEEGN